MTDLIELAIAIALEADYQLSNPHRLSRGDWAFGTDLRDDALTFVLQGNA